MAAVAITGASGLIGGHLARQLAAQGWEVRRLVRDRSRVRPPDLFWNPDSNEIDVAGLQGCAAVVHLAGESIFGLRWTKAKKERIRESRVRGTTLLAEGLARLASPPRVLISGSAVGYYGDRGAEMLTEASPPGSGFLAEVAQEWEAATAPASRAGVRVVTLRTGIVLSQAGGALRTMLPAFRWGLGGRVGPGTQYMSWISLPDLAAVIERGLTDDGLNGPLNAVAPEPVQNAAFVRALAAQLRRPAVFPAPAPLLRLIAGEMADALLLASTRAVPTRLLAAGFAFQHAQLDAALRAALESQE